MLHKCATQRQINRNNKAGYMKCFKTLLLKNDKRKIKHFGPKCPHFKETGHLFAAQSKLLPCRFARRDPRGNKCNDHNGYPHQ